MVHILESVGLYAADYTRIAGANSRSSMVGQPLMMIIVRDVCPSWQWHRFGYRWSLVRTLPMAPLWCDKAAINQNQNEAAATLLMSLALLLFSQVRFDRGLFW